MSKKSAIYCEHANEVPMGCPCKDDCYCKEHTCKPKIIKTDTPTTPESFLDYINNSKFDYSSLRVHEIEIISSYLRLTKEDQIKLAAWIRRRDGEKTMKPTSAQAQELLEFVEEVAAGPHENICPLVHPAYRNKWCSCCEAQKLIDNLETKKNHEIRIIINGNSKTWQNKEISYRQVTELAYPDTSKNTLFSITYWRSYGNKYGGILGPGETVKVKDRMIFDVVEMR